MTAQISPKTILLSGLLALSIGNTWAIEVITPRQMKKLLGAYPATGSVEEAQDYETLLKYQENRTEAECALAASEKTATLKHLFAGKEGPLTKKEALLVSPFVLKHYAEAGINIYIAKSTFKRPRPYNANPQIKPCIPGEKSYAYPSGHTAVARVFARVLSRIYPSRAAAFMKRADDVANNRILGGVHHPSDIVAGKKLGDILANKVMNSKKFTTELKRL
jgi:acid phosphatase (class A)